MAYDKITGVYLIRNKRNDKIYIGSSVNIGRRISCHLSGGGSVLIKNAVTKYGIQSFEFYILEICQRRSDLPFAEAHWISSLKPEYNIDLIDTSTGGRIFSEETKEKIRQSRIGKKLSFAQKLLIGKSSSQRCHSEISKKKISEALKGKLMSATTKIKISIALKGKPLTANHIMKLKTSHMGHKHSASTKSKMSLSQTTRRERESRCA